MAEYYATVTWHRNDQDFLGNRYSRGHRWRFDGGAVVPASASPHIVPLPLSVEKNVDPEEAFVAALSSCHMLFFLHFCAKQRFIVDSYRDSAVGVMAKNADGKTAMTKVTLRPEVVFGEQTPSRQELEQLHHLAHQHCFIANSVTAEVVTEIV